MEELGQLNVGSKFIKIDSIWKRVFLNKVWKNQVKIKHHHTSNETVTNFISSLAESEGL